LALELDSAGGFASSVLVTTFMVTSEYLRPGEIVAFSFKSGLLARVKCPLDKLTFLGYLLLHLESLRLNSLCLLPLLGLSLGREVENFSLRCCQS
jgi:hypothetical protein